MENRKIPALIAVAGVVIALVVFFFVIDDDTADQETETTISEQTTQPDTDNGGGGGGKKPDKPEEPDEPEVPEIEIQNGEPVGGPQELEFTEGDEIRINVVTDAEDELHFHGYDLYFDIVPGKTNEVVVESADIGGVFELESHTTAALLAEISVVPG